MTFDLTLSRQLGVDPRLEMDRLHGYRKAGARYPLILGGEPVGGVGALWIITQLAEEINPGFTRASLTLQLAPSPPAIATSSGNLKKSGVERRKAA